MKNIYIINQKTVCRSLTEVSKEANIDYNTLTHAFSRQKVDSGNFNKGEVFVEKMSIKTLCDIVSKIKVIDYENFDIKVLIKSLQFLLTETNN